MTPYLEAPAAWTGPAPQTSVFLAGGITGCPDWQAQARIHLEGTGALILNPRRAVFDITDRAAAPEQIAWENHWLRHATVTLFWFPPSGNITQPIALYELGAAAATGKTIAVGADSFYCRRDDVIFQLRHARPELHVHSTLRAVCAEATELLTAAPHRQG